MNVVPYGESAAFVDLGELAPREVAAIARALRERLPGADVVVGRGCLAIANVSGWDDLAPIVADAIERARSIEAPPGREIAVDVIYDGPDLDDVARVTGLSRDRVIALHADATYDVELLGFLPGFAYLGPLDDRLVLPRKPTPRPRVSAGSVAIAGAQTGVYTID